MFVKRDEWERIKDEISQLKRDVNGSEAWRKKKEMRGRMFDAELGISSIREEISEIKSKLSKIEAKTDELKENATVGIYGYGRVDLRGLIDLLERPIKKEIKYKRKR